MTDAVLLRVSYHQTSKRLSVASLRSTENFDWDSILKMSDVITTNNNNINLGSGNITTTGNTTCKSIIHNYTTLPTFTSNQIGYTISSSHQFVNSTNNYWLIQDGSSNTGIGNKIEYCKLNAGVYLLTFNTQFNNGYGTFTFQVGTTVLLNPFRTVL